MPNGLYGQSASVALAARGPGTSWAFLWSYRGASGLDWRRRRPGFGLEPNGRQRRGTNNPLTATASWRRASAVAAAAAAVESRRCLSVSAAGRPAVPARQVRRRERWPASRPVTGDRQDWTMQIRSRHFRAKASAVAAVMGRVFPSGQYRRQRQLPPDNGGKVDVINRGARSAPTASSRMPFLPRASAAAAATAAVPPV